ncbi:hypothetical protein ACOI1C_06995 [Bacillus sp. DJP31]|uniref:hypothetical protein n=1 Tax=Bacillus sp. DJP31 TaxID=3409789 RepID=UPI003BB5962E
MKRTILKVFVVFAGMLLLFGCGSKESTTTGSQTDGGPTEIKFEDFFTKSTTGEGEISEKMLELNGKRVGIMGYMTELTPIDNRFIYLVPNPGSACPFCSADNPKYLEAIAIYPPDGKEVEFTQSGLWAFGILEVGEEVDEATGLISMFRLKADSIEVHQQR